MKIIFSKYFWGSIALIILLIVLSFGITSFRSVKQGQQPTAGLSIPFFPFLRPTPIPTQVLNIQEKQPNDGDIDVDPATPIGILFSRGVTSSEKLHIRLGITPTATGDAVWSNDNTQLTLTPHDTLLSTTKYTVTLIFLDKSETWSFTTGPVQPTPAPGIQQGRNQQAIFDDQWGKIIENIYTNYPWYTKLPLSTPDYFVSFDIGQNAIVASLFPQDPTSTSQVEAIKKEVQTALVAINVDIQHVRINYQVGSSVSPTPVR